MTDQLHEVWREISGIRARMGDLESSTQKAIDALAEPQAVMAEAQQALEFARAAADAIRQTGAVQAEHAETIREILGRLAALEAKR